MQPIVVLYLLWVLWFLTWLAVAIAGDPGPHKVKGPLLLVYRLVILAATLLLFTLTPWPGLDVQYRFWDRELSEEVGWVLTAIAAGGFMLAWWGTVSRLIAGKQQGNAVDHSPYAFVHHPVHLGLIVAAIATAVLFGRPSSSAGAAMFILVFVAKILMEKRIGRDDETVDHAERASPPIPHELDARTSTQLASARPSQPAAVRAKPEAPASEDVAELPLKPVQFKLSLDKEEKGSTPALTEADLKP